MIVYTIFGLVHLCLALGIKSHGGSIGWINMVDLYNDGARLMATLGLFYSILATLLVAAIGYTWWKAFRYYRDTGLDQKTFSEATKVASEYAYENREVIVQAAKDNPEAAQSFAQTATSFSFDHDEIL